MAVHDGREVLDVNLAASAQGVRVGMTVREAQSFAPVLESHVYREELCSLKRDEWLDVATLYSNQVLYIAPHQAFLDLSGHPHPEEVARLFQDHLERRFAYTFVSALSPTHWVSQVLARHPMRAVDLVGLALANESVMKLTPIDRAIRERLVFLGYKRIRDLQSLSVSTLIGQFGAEGHRILAAANGGLHEQVRANYPASSICHSLELTGGCSDFEQITSALGELSRGLFAELCSQAKVAKDIHLMISLEDETRETSATFAKPFRGSLGLQNALLKLLLDLEIREPIYRLRVTLPSLCQANVRQRTMTGVAADPGFVDDSLEAVRHKFGSYSVHRGCEHEEPRRVRVLRAWAAATGWR